MRRELKELQRRTGITFVYVTHDQAEAMALSDRVAVMHLGELMQLGTPREVYTRPANRTVADFMGLVNLIPAHVVRAAGDTSVVAVGGTYEVVVTLPPVPDVTFLGNLTDGYVTFDDSTRVRVQADPGQILEVGQPVAVRFDSAAVTMFDK